MKRLRPIALLAAVALGCRARAPEPNPDLAVAAAGDAFALPLPRTVKIPSRLMLGVLPVFEPDQMIETYRPLAAYLGRELGTEVEIELTDTYEQLIDAVVRGEIDIAQLAPLTYVVAKERESSLTLIATNIAEGSSTYSGYILTKSDAQIQSAADFRGMRFGFVDYDSSSGYLYPYAFFLEQGILPERDFKSVVMTKRHDLAIEALLRGEIDGAATFSGALLNAEARGLDVERVHIVAKTGRIPYDAWCVRGSLDKGLHAMIQRALLALSTRTIAGRRILGPLKVINGFATTNDAAYDEVRRLKHLVDDARN
jgi:phosphate/phosphite/phosphonate ABC transporter binding protein